MDEVFKGFNLIKYVNINEVHFLFDSLPFPVDEIRFFNKDLAVRDFWDFYYVVYGSVELIYHGDLITLKKGDVFFIEPNISHKIHREISCHYYKYTFAAKSIALDFLCGKKLKLPGGLKKNVVDIYHEADITFSKKNRSFPNCIDLSTLEINSPSRSCWQQFIVMNLEYVIINLVRAYTENEQQLFKMTKRVKSVSSNIMKFLESNLYNRISLYDICKEFSYGRTALSNEFKSAYGYGIMEYYNLLKINEAKKMINESKYTFSEIAEALKFTSEKYFARVFVRFADCTPSEYKKRQNVTV